jgi:hypothetical protein
MQFMSKRISHYMNAFIFVEEFSFIELWDNICSIDNKKSDGFSLD